MARASTGAVPARACTARTRPSGCRSWRAWNWPHLRHAPWRSSSISRSLGHYFLGGLFLFFKIADRYTGLGADNRNIKVELNFFENWYSVVYLVLFFGLSLYLGNGKTLGKRVMGIRVVSLVHHRMSLWHSIERALG